MARSLIAALFGLSASASNAVTDQWPKLPRSGFITGRVAKEADVAAGDAIFVARSGGALIGKPASVTVPQYGYLLTDGGRPVAIVIVQAETSEKGILYGLRDAMGHEYVATDGEVKLLGTIHP